MRYVKWIFWTIFWVLLAGFLHYTLPQHDIVRITDTFERRVDPGNNRWFWAQADTGSAAGVPNRDVFFIQTIQDDGDPMVYRNEDTGWGWPPYFKFDTNNLQARAADLRSTREAPKWVAVRHYGWRNEFISIFPNATKLWQVEGPDVRIIPWFNIVFLLVFAAVFWGLRVRWLRFWRRRVDPLTEDVGDSWQAEGGRRKRWFGSRD